MKYTILISDSPIGIFRNRIGGEEFALTRFGKKLTLEILIENIHEMMEGMDKEYRIVLAFAHGFDANLPQMAPKDLFHRHTTHSTAKWHQERAEKEAGTLKELDRIAQEHSVTLLKLDQIDSLQRWLREEVAEEDAVMLLNSSQLAFNIPLSKNLLSIFDKNRRDSLMGQGHNTGLLPAFYKARVLPAAMPLWGQKGSELAPLAEAILNINPEIEKLEQAGFMAHYRSGYNTQLALLLKSFPDIKNMSMQELTQSCQQVSAQYQTQEGKKFIISWNDRIRFWNEMSRTVMPAPTYEAVVKQAQQEQLLLQQRAGIDFKEKNVLEIGCGAGELTLSIKALGAKSIVGTDIEVELGAAPMRQFLSLCPEEMKEIIKVNLDGKYPEFDEGIRFQDCPGEELPFDDNTFDIVYSNQVLEHVKDPLKCLQEMKRVLVPGGVMLMRYNPYFHILGGHGSCTTDIPWGHLRMNKDEFYDYLVATESEERAEHAKNNLETYFNPTRLTLADFDKCLEVLAPMLILHYETTTQAFHSEMLTKSFVRECRQQYPDVTLKDLITNSVTLIARKISIP